MPLQLGRQSAMAEKYKNKYRVPSARLQTWNYGWDAAYFITICTKNRKWFFGDVVDNEMKLSQIGIMADLCWYEIKNHAKNVKLGEYIVMPNHVHGIVVLDGNNGSSWDVDGDGNRDGNGNRDGTVETRHALSLPTPMSMNNKSTKTIGQQRFQNQGKNTISSIIGAYKSAVSFHAHRLEFEFDWQARFYDNIIRSEGSFQRITEYIKDNPANWKEDRFY